MKRVKNSFDNLVSDIVSGGRGSKNDHLQVPEKAALEEPEKQIIEELLKNSTGSIMTSMNLRSTHTIKTDPRKGPRERSSLPVEKDEDDPSAGGAGSGRVNSGSRSVGASPGNTSPEGTPLTARKLFPTPDPAAKVGHKKETNQLGHTLSLAYFSLLIHLERTK